jgi:hypothetical protein
MTKRTRKQKEAKVSKPGDKARGKSKYALKCERRARANMAVGLSVNTPAPVAMATLEAEIAEAE